MPSPSSSAQQALLALAGRLREIRHDARLTGRALASLTGWQPSKISKIEHGKQAPSADDVHAWCEQCGAAEHAVDLVASLRAVEGMFVEWRRLERTGLRLENESLLPLWERTRHFRIYSSRLVPGPVQTRGYIQAILTGVRIRRNLPDDVEAAVQVRVDKQHVVHEGDHRFAIVLEESVFRYPVGGVEAMAAQLGHLLVASVLPAISLGVIPLGTDRSATLPVEGFWVFDDERVHVELVSGRLTVTQPREVAMYAKVFAALAAQAVYGAEARKLITAAITALDTDPTGESNPQHIR